MHQAVRPVLDKSRMHLPLGQTVGICGVVIGSLLLSVKAAAQCDDWRAGPLFDIPGVNGRVNVATTWDPDGSGPLPAQLVIAGTFTSASGTTVNNIARWDGAAWQPFGSGVFEGGGAATYVLGLATLPANFGAFAGNLVAVGQFSESGGIPTYGFSRWDGSAWHAVAAVQYGIIRAVTIWDPDGSGPQPPELVVAGIFQGVGTVGTSDIAGWDGTNWHAFGPGLSDGWVYALTTWDPDGAGPLPAQLIAAGGFHAAGGTAVNGIARWDGSAWQPLGNGPCCPDCSCVVYGLGVIPPGNGQFAGQLVAGSDGGISRWDGSAWHAMGIARYNNGAAWVMALTAVDPDGSGPLGPELIAGGNFNEMDGAAVSPNVARWDGSAWQSVGTGFTNDVQALVGWDPDGGGSQPLQLVAGGEFEGNGSGVFNSIAHFSGTQWLPFTESAVGAQVYALTNFRNYVAGAGSFTLTGASGASPHNLALWDGDFVGALDTGLSAPAHVLKSYNTGVIGNQFFHLLAGGEFTAAGGLAANHIAVWSENELSSNPPPTWAPLGPGLNDIVFAAERFNNLTIAGGQFTATGDGVTPLAHIGQWNGTAWQPLGTGLNGPCYALKVYNNSLYAGGSFTIANGTLHTGGLARWDGAHWNIVGGNFMGTVYTLEVYDNKLTIGGLYPGINGSPNIAQYDSTTGLYSTLGTGGTDNTVYALLSENGDLYVGGQFAHAGGLAAAHLARWNGSSWSSVRGGTDGTVFALAGFHNEVHAGGAFSSVRSGALNTPGWARYLETGAPWVVEGPQSVTGACGAEVSFSVRGAVGYSQTITWRHDGMPLADGPTGTGSTIGGAHNGTLDVANIGAADQGTYDAVLSNACGSDTSPGAALAVTFPRGDMNCDCRLDFGDLNPFVLALSDPAGYHQQFPDCDIANGDINGDGLVDFGDINPFVALLAH